MNQSNQRTDLTAAEWAVRLNERALTAQEQAELDQWLDADTRHRGALLRARAAWADLDRLAALGGRSELPTSRSEEGNDSFSRSAPAPETVEEFQLPLLEGRQPSLLQPLPPEAQPGGQISTEGTDRRGAITSRFPSDRRRFIAASAATLLLGAGGAWWIERRDLTYVSKLGEIRRVTLADGSHMVLNTSTEATVRFDKTRREIELASGEGLFQVAKDPARPFIVRAGFVSVRAVGTVFAVRTAGQQVDVTVTEGVVELVDNSRPGGGVIRQVAANERATIMETSQVQVQSIPHNAAERQLAWRDGMVDFAGEPLTTAVAEINRHNRRHIVVDDAALASRPVVGLFRATDPDNFAATVATALGAKSVDLDDAIHLRQGSTP
jgi:transmembrane sensor